MAEVGFGPPLTYLSVLLADFMSLVKYYFYALSVAHEMSAFARPTDVGNTRQRMAGDLWEYGRLVRSARKDDYLDDKARNRKRSLQGHDKPATTSEARQEL